METSAQSQGNEVAIWTVYFQGFYTHALREIVAMLDEVAMSNEVEPRGHVRADLLSYADW